MSKYVRKFQIKLDGQDEAIFMAALTAGQVEEYLKEQEEAKSEPDVAARTKRNVANIHQLIVNSLNNAKPEGDPGWTIPKLKDEFDNKQLDQIFEKASQESGLVFPNQKAPTTL